MFLFINWVCYFITSGTDDRCVFLQVYSKKLEKVKNVQIKNVQTRFKKLSVLTADSVKAQWYSLYILK